MNILIITDTNLNCIGGSENHIRFMINNLSGFGMKFFIIELYHCEHASKEDNTSLVDSKHEYTRLGLPVHRIYGISAVRTWVKLNKIISKYNIDIVVSFHEKSDILNSLLLRRKKQFVKISSRRDLGINPSRLLLWLRRQFVRNMDYIIAPSQSILDIACRNDNINNERTLVIPNGIDVRRFNSAIGAKDIIDIAHGKICGVCVANLKKIKGHKYLIKAFRSVANLYPNAILLIVGGDSGEGSRLKSQVKNLCLEQNIYFFNSRNDIPEVLACCDFMVSASLSEGLSNALIEGIASGLPVIATNVGGNVDIVQDGYNGYVCPPANSNCLASKIKKLLEEPHEMKTFGRRSYYIALQKFDYSNVIAKYRSFFNNSL